MNEKSLPTAQNFIILNWEQLQDKNLQYLRVHLTDKCQPYDEHKLIQWFNKKKSREKKKEGKSGMSLETGSTLGSKQATLDFFQEDGSVGAKKGQLGANEELKLAKGLAKEPIEHIDPVIAAETEKLAAQFLDADKPTFLPRAPGFVPFQHSPMIGTTVGPKFIARVLSSPSSQQSSSSGENSEIFAQKRLLKLKPVWADVALVFKMQAFLDYLKHPFSYEWCMSFLIQGRKEKNNSHGFASAVAVSISWLKKHGHQITADLAISYLPFFDDFEVHHSHTLDQLTTLFQFCRYIKGNINWLKQLKEPCLLIQDVASLHDCATIIYRLFQCKQFYSLEYFDFIEYVIATPMTARPCESFVQLLQIKNLRLDLKWKKALQQYSRLKNSKHGEVIFQTAEQLLLKLETEILFSKLLIAIEVALKLNNTDDVKTLMQEQFNSVEELEQLLANQFKAITMLQIQQELSQQENEKIQKERIETEIAEKIDKQLKLKEEHEAFSRMLGEFGLEHEKELKIAADNFVPVLRELAEKVGKKLRLEQLITMGLLLESKQRNVLVQLATGFGKSLMLGIMASYINVTTKNKVLVVVPTPFLHLYQESNYCPTASKIPEDINDPTANQIFYCTYDQFLQLDPFLLSSVIVLVDEFHELFFNYPATVAANGKFISVIQQLMAAKKVIGASATFRGDAGIKKIATVLTDSLFIPTSEKIKEKELQLDVFGKLSMAAIKEKTILLAEEKSQQMPVVVFCADIIACQEWKTRFPVADIFAGDNPGELVALLEQFKELSKGIILATSTACKGADFVFAVPQAFVIHTLLSQSWLQLQQDSGRGVRRHQDLPVLGAIFTEKPYTTIDQVKKALSFSDRFDQLFTTDYLIAHSLIVACSPSNFLQPITSFQKAVVLMNEGKSAAIIHKLLYSIKRFRDFLPENVPTQFTIIQQQDTVMVEEKASSNVLTHQQQIINTGLQDLKLQSSSRQAIQDEVNNLQEPEVSAFWDEPIITQNNEEFKTAEDRTKVILGKRGCPEKLENTASKQTKIMTTVETCEQITNKNDLRAFGTLSMVKRQKLDDLQQLEYQTLKDDLSVVQELDAEYERSAFQEDEIVAARSELKPDLLSKIAKAQALNTLREQKEDNDASSGQLTNLNLQPARKAKTVVPSKKRDAKLEIKSLTGRSITGKFEGRTQFGSNWFKKKGMNKQGKQQWQCIACKKGSTIEPENHQCTN